MNVTYEWDFVHWDNSKVENLKLKFLGMDKISFKKHIEPLPFSLFTLLNKSPRFMAYTVISGVSEIAIPMQCTLLLQEFYTIP